MGPARGANVVLADSFTTDVESLRSTYPEIDAVVAELVEFLQLGYDVPHVPIDDGNHASVYAAKRDYPPHGADGRGVFAVTYHASAPGPLTMHRPYRTFTLLTIVEIAGI